MPFIEGEITRDIRAAEVLFDRARGKCKLPVSTEILT